MSKPQTPNIDYAIFELFYNHGDYMAKCVMALVLGLAVGGLLYIALGMGQTRRRRY